MVGFDGWPKVKARQSHWSLDGRNLSVVNAEFLFAATKVITII
jgi:hypothetical protein